MKNLIRLKIFSMAFLMSVAALQLSAQDGQRGQRPGGGQGGRPGGPGRGFQMTEEDIKNRVDNLGETLKFSTDQHKKIMDYELEFSNRMQIEFQKYRNQSGPPPDREAMRANMMKFREERDEKYKEVLTEDQMAKFTEIQEQRRSEMRGQYRENNPRSENSERPERGRGRN